VAAKADVPHSGSAMSIAVMSVFIFLVPCVVDGNLLATEWRPEGR
jgi:hypothetical protein